jgi:hypothetical protein
MRASKTANDAPLYRDIALGRDGDERVPDTAAGLGLPYQIGQAPTHRLSLVRESVSAD